MKGQLVLFDDARARAWAPLALTRPMGELRFGSMRLVSRVERSFGVACAGYLTAGHLADFGEPGARPVLNPDELPTADLTLFWCARAALAGPVEFPEEPTTYVLADRAVGCALPAGESPDPGFLNELVPERLPGTEVGVEGRLLEWIWELVLETPEWTLRDLEGDGRGSAAGDLPAGVHVLGSHPLILGDGVRIEPTVVFDLREGPVRLDDGVEVRAGTRLTGPSAIGPHSRLLGGALERISAGPFSYLHGELSESLTLGYVNKVHDGYIGHCYLGRWVNLGAFTTNSDLKNNYHPVRVWTPQGERDTGELKVGCFFGDHAKTGIGTLLNTGTVVGAGSNLYGGVMPPKYVPPFSWGRGDRLGEYRLEDFIDTAATVMARRSQELDERGRRYLESCWREGRGG